MRRLVHGCSALAILVGAAGLLHHDLASAQSPGRYSLSARADSVGLIVAATQAPLSPTGQIAFLTPSSTQAILDSLGTSRAFASAPNIGDFLITLPGTITGLGAATGAIPPVPTPPFFVESDPINPERSEEVGPYSIRASSTETASSREARIGLSTLPPQVGSIATRASVSVDPDTGKIVARATAEIEPFAVSTLVRIGEIRSQASLTYDPDAGVVKETSLSVGTITVGGTELGLTDQGLVLAGAPLLPVDLAAVTGLLEGAGLGFEYIPARETETSVTSAAVRLTFVQEVPSLGTATVTALLGQVWE